MIARRLALVTGLIAVVCVPCTAPAGSSSGWTLQLVYAQDVEALDPALAYSPGSQALLYLTCETLIRYPDAAAPRGARPVLGGAAALPRVSADGRTYTFTLRSDVRFSDGSPVTAANYAAAINRVLDPQMNSFAAGLYLGDIVGAQAVMNGKATEASGVVARGRTLTIRLHDGAPDILARLSLTPFCPIPVDLPHDPAGVDVIPGSGPYAVSSRVAGQKIVLDRNRYYRGPRPHGPSRIVVTVGGTDQSDLAAVESGAADYATDVVGAGGVAIDPESLHRLVARYGINRGRFFFEPTLQINFFALNTRHGIFAGNPSLRRAVNFAVDRHALAATFGFLGVRPTDQLLPSGVPGFIDAHLYPLGGPDLARARALARGHLRGGKAVMYARDSPRSHLLAEIIAFDLAKIGIRLDVEYFPGAIANQKAQGSSRGFDIISVGWLANYDDPDFYLPPFLAGDNVPPNGLNSNYSYFDDATVNKKLAVATRLHAPARYAAFGRLDVQIMRAQAPVVPYANNASYFLVAKRIGCVIYNPVFGLDYAAVCLKRSH
jgi:peptide/nickel transport system substrate-binding protein